MMMASSFFQWLLTQRSIQTIALNVQQDGRLAPAYFLPNYKYFDQLLQTVKNKTTVLNLVFKEFLQTTTVLNE